VLAISDHDRSIISVVLGFSDSASEAMVQQQADWARFPGEHFSLGELLLGDKGMHYTNKVVGPQKGQSGQTTSNKNFDWQLARLRVISEHTFGIVKGRWASLEELRLPIGSQADFLAALEWILACCVLHNVCTSVSYGEVEPSPTLDAAEEPSPAHPEAKETHSRVKRDVLAFYEGHWGVQVLR